MAKTIQCHKVYKFRMEPTELQGLELSRAAAVARFVYNWALERCQEHYKQHVKTY
ncbi:MAG TPA: helix-turn-helix domain-containing protein [Terriglobales bacterium]|nr:helix-turn-helix domain-containing protein [Terriglobales bacterium]